MYAMIVVCLTERHIKKDELRVRTRPLLPFQNVMTPMSLFRLLTFQVFHFHVGSDTITNVDFI